MSSGAPAEPRFLVVGAMKCGTTSLDRYLRAHPDVAMPTRDLDFFSRHYDRGVGWYRRQFPGRPGVVWGETSVSYSMHPHFPRVPERIRSAAPDVRLIYIVRNPLERILSHYLHRVYAREETRGLEAALGADGEAGPYLSVSRYASQLERFLACFERARILVLPLESLRAEDERFDVLQRVYSFLGLPPTVDRGAFARVEHRTSHKGLKPSWARRLAGLPGYGHLARRTPRRLREAYARAVSRPVPRPTLSPALRRTLVDRLSPEVDRLGMLTGVDFATPWGWPPAS